MIKIDVTVIEQIASSQFVWSIVALSIGYAFYNHVTNRVDVLKAENTRREDQLVALYETQKSESLRREERLMAHVEKTTETLNRIDANLDKLESDMSSVHTRIDDLSRKIG